MSRDSRTSPSSIQITHKTFLEWKVDKINPAFAAAKAGEQRRLSSRDVDGWYLSISLNEKDPAKKQAYVYLTARPQEADYERFSFRNSWDREGVFTATFDLLTVDQNVLCPPRVHQDLKFTSSGGEGWGGELPWDIFEKEGVKEKNGLIVRCVIEKASRPTSPSTDDYYDSYEAAPKPAFSDFYENKEHTDVVFRIDGDGQTAHAPSYSFGLKIILEKQCSHLGTVLFVRSGFAESQKNAKHDLRALTFEPTSVYRGDGNDFLPFQLKLDSDEPSLPHQLSDCRSHTGPSAPQDPQVDSDSVEDGPSANIETGEDEPSKKKRKTDSTMTDVTEVVIKDCSFATFNAFLYYLYSGKLALFPSVSEYLVSYHQANPLDEFDDALTWMKRKTPSIRYSSNPHGCLPHALYRLADRYRALRLREKVKGYIVRSLTVENVAYEAFSSLSTTFGDIQKPVVEYLLEHWDEVKSTKAMKQVLELLAEGSLPDGAEVLSKILSALPKPAVVEDKK